MRAMKLKQLPLVIPLALVIAVPLFAHHSIFGEFDSTKPITLTGIVSNVDWMNPLLAEPLQIVDGMAIPSSRPGLGLEWNQDFVRYTFRRSDH